MKLPSDLWLYRKDLMKRVALWRNIAIALIAIVTLYYLSPNKIERDYIGKVVIEGQILEDQFRDSILAEIENNSKVKALVVYINSPGGSVYGGEALHHQLRTIAAKKPVVVVMGTVAASAGYMVAVAGDYVIARNSTITGSIGVLFISAEVSELAKKIGIEFIVLKSGALKAEPLPFHKLTDKVKEQTMNTIMDSYNMFVDIVTQRRKLPKEQVLKLADGRVFTGRQALKEKLIDQIGSEHEALQWLQDKKSLSKTLKVKEISVEKRVGWNILLLSYFMAFLRVWLSISLG